MTVSDLITRLQAMPGEAKIWMWSDRDGCMVEPEPELFSYYVSFTAGRLWTAEEAKCTG